MNTLLRILIESTLVLSVFYAFYLLFFAKDKDFRFSRAYLMISSLLAILIPQLNIPILPADQMTGIAALRIHRVVQLPEIIVTDSTNTFSQGLSLTPAFIILLIYVGGLSLFLIKFLTEIIRLFLFIYQNPDKIEQRSFYKMIYTGGRIPTSSFFNYLFWDETVSLGEEEKNQIIKHEEGHISQLHSFDILYLELLCILFWFNPFIHGYRKAIATVHEYLADEYVMKKNPGHHYLNLLARQVLISCNLSINNHFSKSRTLKRIRMIKSNHRKPALLRWGLSLSVLGLMFYLFACDLNESTSEENSAASQFPLIAHTQIITADQIDSRMYRNTVKEWIKSNPGKAYVLIESTDPDESLSRIFQAGNWEIRSHHKVRENLLYALVCPTPANTYKRSEHEWEYAESDQTDNRENQVFSIVDTQPEPLDGFESFSGYIMENLVYPENAKMEGKEGKVFVEFIVRKNGKIDAVKVIKGFDEGCDAEALRVIRQSPDWIPGYKDEKAVDVKLVLPITFKLG